MTSPERQRRVAFPVAGAHGLSFLLMCQAVRDLTWAVPCSSSDRGDRAADDDSTLPGTTATATWPLTGRPASRPSCRADADVAASCPCPAGRSACPECRDESF